MTQGANEKPVEQSHYRFGDPPRPCTLTSAEARDIVALYAADPKLERRYDAVASVKRRHLTFVRRGTWTERLR